MFGHRQSFFLVIFSLSWLERGGCWFGRPRPQRTDKSHDMAIFKGGMFQMGVNDREGRNAEAPVYKSAVKPFRMDKHLVTNEDFLRFRVAKKNFETDAETRGWSHVFAGHLHEETIMLYQHHEPDEESPFLVPLMGASWSKPVGQDSSVGKLLRHPVVHVSKRDAQAYCFWKGKRLPTEFEWEFAARGGLRGQQYPWGDAYKTGYTNLWQGQYPVNDTGRDGYAGTSPVDAFPAQNDHGLRDLVGNVWEWTNTAYHFRHIPQEKGHFVIKGGSYLDSRKGHVNLKARTSARDGKVYYYSAGNLGFRCAESAPEIPSPKIDMSRQQKVTRVAMIHSEL